MQSKRFRPALIGTAALGLVAGLAMILIGLPEATPTQTVLLELSSLPLSLAAMAALVLLWQWAGAPLGPRSKRVLGIALGGVGVGLVLIALAYLSGPRALIQLGQTLIWISILIGLVVLFRRPRRLPLPRFEPIEFDPEDQTPSSDD